MTTATANRRNAKRFTDRRAKQSHSDRALMGSVREIGPPPKRKGGAKARWESCRYDLGKFCKSYLADSFPLRWSRAQRRAIAKMENAVLNGGLFALAMRRGGGKSTLSQACALWALLYGHRRYVVLIGATQDDANDHAKTIKMWLETNEALFRGFPAHIHPIRKLERQTGRQLGQICEGHATYIKWSESEIHLPWLPDHGCKSGILRCVGITGNIRGKKHAFPDGTQARPDFVIPDDVQTEESAANREQTRKRFKIIMGDVLGLAGPDVDIAGVCPCTVIYPGDLSEQLLDHPDFNGERTGMVETWPDRMDLWREYERIRREGFRNGDGGRAADAYYRKHRKEMDAGAVLDWPDAHPPTAQSALQHAFNLKIRDAAAFFAEYQNQPTVEDGGAQLKPSDVWEKTNGLPRGVIPANTDYLTIGVDVQETLLYYAICAVTSDFSVSVVDYGAYPDQGLEYFTLRDARPLLGDFSHGDVEAQILNGLHALLGGHLERPWEVEDGSQLLISSGLVDANYQTDTVYSALRTIPVIQPAHGHAVTASQTPMNDWNKKAGEKVGHNWRRRRNTGRVRHIIHDVNYWKSFLAARIRTPAGDTGSMTFWGTDAGRHKMVADHITAEYAVRTSGRQRMVDEWKLRPTNPDNHLLDALVLALVAASFEGATLPSVERKQTGGRRGGYKKRPA